jgi:hypothetical protein
VTYELAGVEVLLSDARCVVAVPARVFDGPSLDDPAA